MSEQERLGSTASVGGRAEEASHTQWAFWLEWVSVTVVGSVLVSGLAFVLTKLLGHVGLDQGDSSTEYLLVLPAVSLSVGLMQWLILRRHIRQAGWWIVAAALASVVSGLLLGDPGPPSYPAPYALHLVLGLPLSIILGSVPAGLVQWSVLRRQARRPGLYVVGSAVGWGVATFVAGLTFTWSLSSGMGPALTMWGMVCGILYGAISASMLSAFLPDPKELGSRSLLVAGGAVTLVVALTAAHVLGTSMTEEKLVRQYQAGARDFSGASLRQARLSSANLREIVLRRADLREADLQGADLSGAVLTVADLGYADLCGADLSGSDLRGAYLHGASLRNASLHEADLGFIAHPDSPCPDVGGADLTAPVRVVASGQRQGASPWTDDLSLAGLKGASLRLAGAGTTSLSATCLLWMGLPMDSVFAPHPSLFEPVECRTDLSDADLHGADLSHANLRRAILTRANLEGANLYSADLTWADLRGAAVSDEQLAQAESLERATLPDGTVHE